MLVKLFGVMDVYCALVIILLHYHLNFWFLAPIAYIYLIVKWIAFFSDLTSLVDGLIGVYLFLMTFGLVSIIDFFLFIWLAQKGVFSLIKF